MNHWFQPSTYKYIYEKFSVKEKAHFDRVLRSAGLVFDQNNRHIRHYSPSQSNQRDLEIVFIFFHSEITALHLYV